VRGGAHLRRKSLGSAGFRRSTPASVAAARLCPSSCMWRRRVAWARTGAAGAEGMRARGEAAFIGARP
jgi:hypothetical protein